MPAAMTTLTIQELVAGKSAPDPEQTFLIRHLEQRLYHNLAPLLLMTNGQLKNIPLVGKARAHFLLERLHALGFELRSNDQRLVDRAIELYDSVEHVPLQALTLVMNKRYGVYVVTGQKSSRVVSEVLKVWPEATLGAFMYAYTSRQVSDSLRAVLRRYGASEELFEYRVFCAMVRQLKSHLEYWDDALAQMALRQVSTSHRG